MLQLRETCSPHSAVILGLTLSFTNSADNDTDKEMFHVSFFCVLKLEEVTPSHHYYIFIRIFTLLH